MPSSTTCTEAFRGCHVLVVSRKHSICIVKYAFVVNVCTMSLDGQATVTELMTYLCAAARRITHRICGSSSITVWSATSHMLLALQAGGYCSGFQALSSLT